MPVFTRRPITAMQIFLNATMFLSSLPSAASHFSVLKLTSNIWLQYDFDISARLLVTIVKH
jgi:hypothetical protein